MARDLTKTFDEEYEDFKNDIIVEFKKLEPSPCGPFQGPGVYGVFIKATLFTKRERLLYIGSSKNIAKRVRSERHPYMKCFRRFDEYYVYTKSFPMYEYAEAERVLIAHFKPLLNKNLRNG